MSEVIPVRVRLTTRMAQDGQEESYQFEEDGQLVTLANGQRYLRYTEHQAGQATPVQFRLGDGAIQLTRNGPVKPRLTFDRETKTTSRYHTPYGIIQLTVITDELVAELNWPRASGSLHLAYQLTAGDQLVGTYQIELRFEA